jgi:Leucine-rich repeat (LRR) protein
MELLELSNVEFPKTLVTLSLMNNRLENVGELINKIQYLNLKALWVNGNPLTSAPELLEFIEKKTRIELFNRKFTKQATEWGVKYAHSKSVNFADITTNGEIYKLELDGRDVFNLDLTILESFKNLRSLSIKDHECLN